MLLVGYFETSTAGEPNFNGWSADNLIGSCEFYLSNYKFEGSY